MNQTHASTTDPEARLFRQGKGKEAKLCFMGHVLMDNRHGLIITPRLTAATGTAARDAAERLVGDFPGPSPKNKIIRRAGFDPLAGFTY